MSKEKRKRGLETLLRVSNREKAELSALLLGAFLSLNIDNNTDEPALPPVEPQIVYTQPANGECGGELINLTIGGNGEFNPAGEGRSGEIIEGTTQIFVGEKKSNEPGVTRYDWQKNIVEQCKIDLGSDATVNDFLELPDGRLIVAVDGVDGKPTRGLFMWDGKGAIKEFPHQPPSNVIYAVSIDAYGKLNVATLKGVYRFNDESKQWEDAQPPEFPKVGYHAMLFLPNTAFLYGAVKDDGLYIRTATNRIFRVRDSQIEERISSTNEWIISPDAPEPLRLPFARGIRKMELLKDGRILVAGDGGDLGAASLAIIELVNNDTVRVKEIDTPAHDLMTVKSFGNHILIGGYESGAYLLENGLNVQQPKVIELSNIPTFDIEITGNTALLITKTGVIPVPLDAYLPVAKKQIDRPYSKIPPKKLNQFSPSRARNGAHYSF